MVAAKDERLGNDNIKNVSLTNFPNYFCRHSLLVTQLLVKVNNKFGVNLTVHDLFNCPTVADMANTIDQLKINNIRK